MNIFYLCYEDLREVHRGSTRHVTEVVTQLALLGHQVDLFLPTSPPTGTFGEGVTVHVIRSIPIRMVDWMLFYIFSALAMCLLGLRHRPDAIYMRELAYNLFPIGVAWFLRRPLLVEVNGPLLDEMKQIGAGSFELGLIRLSQRWTFAAADRVIVVAEQLGDWLIGLYALPRARVVVIPNGTDPDRLQPAAMDVSRQQAGLPEKPIVGFVGSCYPYHDIDTLISAAPDIIQAHPEVRFAIVGDGHMRSIWMDRVTTEHLSDYFLFPGRVAYEEISTYINAFTVCIALFIKDSKGSPVKLYEYMSCGCPVIATANRGIGDVVAEHQAGISVPPYDAEAVTTAVNRLLDDPELGDEMGRHGRETVERDFSWRRVATDIVDVIKKASL